jgi:hypothetical protein
MRVIYFKSKEDNRKFNFMQQLKLSAVACWMQCQSMFNFLMKPAGRTERKIPKYPSIALTGLVLLAVTLTIAACEKPDIPDIPKDNRLVGTWVNLNLETSYVEMCDTIVFTENDTIASYDLLEGSLYSVSGDTLFITQKGKSMRGCGFSLRDDTLSIVAFPDCFIMENIRTVSFIKIN